jgi:enamine deaminase RidA (YjgF/YER057c/UK114 family)
MTHHIDARLRELGIELPVPSRPGANYVPFVRTGDLIAHLREAVSGDLDRVARCVRVAGFVNSMPDFAVQSQVVNGASDVFVEVFGEAGRHTRMAVGVSALPYDVAVEVEAVFEVR